MLSASHSSPPAPGPIAMCIDDSLFDLKLNTRVLERAGVFSRVDTFPCALDALAHIRAGHPPNVIFLDVNMPRMDGFEFLRTATEEFGTAFDNRVVVMLTSSLNPSDRVRAESFSAVRSFLSKPLTVEDAQAIAQSLSGSPGATA